MCTCMQLCSWIVHVLYKLNECTCSSVSISLESGVQCEVRLLVSYVVSCAAWSSSYDIRVFTKDKTMKVSWPQLRVMYCGKACDLRCFLPFFSFLCTCSTPIFYFYLPSLLLSLSSPFHFATTLLPSLYHLPSHCMYTHIHVHYCSQPSFSSCLPLLSPTVAILWSHQAVDRWGLGECLYLSVHSPAQYRGVCSRLAYTHHTILAPSFNGCYDTVWKGVGTVTQTLWSLYDQKHMYMYNVQCRMCNGYQLLCSLRSHVTCPRDRHESRLI